MKTVRVGIIGAGRMGERHAEAYSRIPNVEIVGFADIDKARAENVARKYGKHGFENAHLLVNSDKVDAVSICTPNVSHVEPTLLAAEAGKHVLIEKPLATTLKDCDIIIQSVKKNGIIAMPGQTHRFYPSNVRVNELLQEKAIGKVKIVQDYYLDPGFINNQQVPGWIRDKNAGGGIITDVVHLVDRLRWWLKEEITGVNTLLLDKIRPESDIDEMMMVIIKLTHQVTANLLTISPSWGVRDSQTRIIGDKGTIYMRYGEDVRVGKESWEVHDFPHKSSPPSYEHNLTGFKAELQEFISSIMEERKPALTLEDGKKAVKTVLAIQKSASSGKFVRV
jgi:predicted dehydrogenase